MWEILEYNLENLYINSLNSNGIHGVHFIKNKYNGNIIKIKDFKTLPQLQIKDYSIIKHLGIKQEIKKDIWVFCLFTSKAFMQVGDVIIYNTELTNNLNKYVNYPIIVKNSVLCEYFIFYDNIESYPSYCKKYITSNKCLEENTMQLFNDSMDAYLKTLWRADFNNPITIQDEIYNYYKNKSLLFNNQEIMVYSNSVEYLHFLDITNTDLIKFIENVFKLKNIKGENIIEKSMYNTTYKNLKITL